LICGFAAVKALFMTTTSLKLPSFEG
jgi:hypothetical protein